MNSRTDNGRWTADDAIVGGATAALLRYGTLIRRSFLVLLALLFGSLLLIYLISPLREASFVYTSSNAGSQVPWAAAIPERMWLQGASLFAMLLATNIVLLMLVGRPGRATEAPVRFVWLAQAMKIVIAGIIWVLLAYAFWFAMAIYLIKQAIID